MFWRFALLILLVPQPAWAGWASLGKMNPPTRDGHTLTWRSAQGVLALSVLSPEIVRVRFVPRPELGRDHSYAVVSTPPGDPNAAFDVRPDRTLIRTSALQVTVSHDPLRVAFATTSGQSLDEDDPSRGIGFVDETVRVWKRLRDDEQVYGLGEKTGRLNKRGRKFGGYSYVMWNSDTYAYGDDTDPIYATFPFYMVLRNGRSHGIFFDNIDIHYLDGFNPFTWDRERFPDPTKLIGDLGEQGFKVVTIVDPHPKKQPGWAPYDTGLKGDHFVKNPDGTIYEANVWPSQAERDPAPSVFPDFSKPKTRDWWGGLYKDLLDQGVAGIWNDMNEPAVFTADDTGTMPEGVRFDGEGVPTDHREIHNVYGMLMSRSTHEGLRRLRPDRRPFVLTRATYSGGQRYSALWPGDNVSDWDDMRTTIPMFANLGLSGFPFVGADIGGFAEAPSAELFTRWMQMGVFYPFMRTHTTFGTPEQEPWSYGTRHEDLNRHAIELRYELLPHLYNLLQEASTTGAPVMRPLLFEYPEDPATWSLDDEFLWGSDLLVAPVLREGVVDREVYLPKGDWFDFWSGKRHEGGKRLRVPVTMESVPIFARAGAFVFRQPVVQHTGLMSGQPLIVSVYPAATSRASLYEDEGEGFGYERGASMRRSFEQQRNATGVTLRVDVPEGTYRPAARDLVLKIKGVTARRVLVDGVEIPSLKADDEKGMGWRQVEGAVWLRIRDRWTATEVRAESEPSR